jgi:hypothetical protein
MPPRHHYWTIILEGKPTAFRAHTQEELVPTLRQLQARHPDAVMKWFARGRLWETQEEERAAALARSRPKLSATGDRRPRDWRPGGDHKDPRDRFKVPREEKRRRFAQKSRRDRPLSGPSSSGRPPHFDRSRQFEKEERLDRPPRFERPRSDRGGERPRKRDESRERDDQARPQVQGGFRRRSPRPPARKPGGGKPGGGKRGGGGHQ